MSRANFTQHDKVLAMKGRPTLIIDALLHDARLWWKLRETLKYQISSFEKFIRFWSSIPTFCARSVTMKRAKEHLVLDNSTSTK
jgi:uncharacterized protein involved in response to NO